MPDRLNIESYHRALREAPLQAVCIISIVLLTACTMPAFQQTPAAPPGSDVTQPAATVGATEAAIAGNESESLPTITPTPIPVPDGWVEHTSNALDLRMALPPDWGSVFDEDTRLDLRRDVDNGWVEINRIDGETADEWSVDYSPGMEAAYLLNQLLPALREEGDFSDPRPIHMANGAMAWATDGTYELLEDMLFVAVIGYADHALLILGHGGDETDAWAGELVPLYETIVQHIGAAE